jgi:methionyl-tRNA synthetase
MESGSTLSEDTMAKAKKAAATAYEGVETVEPQPMPAKARKPRAKKGTAAAPAVPVVPAVPVPPAPVPTAAPAAVPTPVPPKAVKKRQPKIVPTTPVAIIPNPTEVLPVDSIREIRVKKQEVDGRSLYVGPKDKVYDLKFKYLGRLKEDKIVSFPDSDEGI